MKSRKSIIIIATMMFTGVFMASCNKENDDHVAPQSENALKAITTTSGGSSVTLYAGQTIDVGTVSFDDVDTDNDNIVDAVEVTYALQGGWELEEIHFWMGSTLQQLPSTKSGNPQIGQFPYNYGNLAGQTTYTFTIPFTEIGFVCGVEGTFFVASHASVRLSTGSGSYQNETAWGDGLRLVQRGNWAMYYNIFITCDNPQGPVTEKETETAFAYNVAYAQTFIANGFNGRWGWTNGPLAQGTYSFDIWAGAGQNDLTKGTLVGTLSMNYSVSDVTVTFNLTGPYMLEEVHVYVGNDILATKNGEFTIAPGQYPNIASDLGGTSSYTFNLSGLSGNVYLVAHATVSGF